MLAEKIVPTVLSSRHTCPDPKQPADVLIVAKLHRQNTREYRIEGVKPTSAEPLLPSCFLTRRYGVAKRADTQHYTVGQRRRYVCSPINTVGLAYMFCNPNRMDSACAGARPAALSYGFKWHFTIKYPPEVVH